MVANGDVTTYLYLNFETEESNSKVVIPSSVNHRDPTLEQITIKRLKSVEKGYVYPYISMSFIRGSSPDRNNNPSLGFDDLGGLFECLQTITELPRARRLRAHKVKRCEISQDGFLIFAYKTMEDMYNTGFASSWKTWTGARLLCKMLPDRFPVKRLSFFKKVGKCHGFTYILMAQIEHLMADCAPALNVLHYMKPKICAVVGAYRGITFKVDADMLSTLHVSDEDHITGYASKLKVLYSNNTASLEFPDYLEFRDDDEELDSQGNHVRGPPTKIIMVSEETQTIIKTEKQTRRRLPRTISIYDFPSMNEKEESTLTFKTADALDEQLETNGIIEFVDCPIGIWRRKIHRKKGHIGFLDISPMTPGYNDNGNIPLFSVRPATPLPTIQLQCATGSPTPTSEIPIEILNSKKADPNENRKCVTRDDSLLARLKEKYFNSPDYPREEFASTMSS